MCGDQLCSAAGVRPQVDTRAFGMPINSLQHQRLFLSRSLGSHSSSECPNSQRQYRQQTSIRVLFVLLLKQTRLIQCNKQTNKQTNKQELPMRCLYLLPLVDFACIYPVVTSIRGVECRFMYLK